MINICTAKRTEAGIDDSRKRFEEEIKKIKAKVDKVKNSLD